MNKCKLCGCKDPYKTFDVATLKPNNLCNKCQRLFGEVLDYKKFPLEQLVVLYQPKVSALTGEMVGAEALIRWKHPHFGLISPVEFLAQLFKLGQSFAVFKHVLSTVLVDIHELSKQGIHFAVSVNVNISDIQDPQFLQVAQSLSNNSSKLPSEVTFEITETEACMEEDLFQQVVGIFNNSRNLTLSMDDYGIGHSSLKRLLSGGFKELKIDRFLTQRVLTNQNHRDVVAHTIQMATTLGLRVVVEGIENREQAILMKKLGADQLQGYFFGKPALLQDIKQTFLEGIKIPA